MGWPERLSFNQSTLPVDREPPLPELLEAAAEAGVGAISLNRSRLEGAGFEEAAKAVRASGMQVVVYQTIGYWTSGRDFAGNPRTQEENLRSLDDAAAVGAQIVGVIAGGRPADGADLEVLRERTVAGISELAEAAAQRGLRIGLELLHPVYAPQYEAQFFTLRPTLDFLDELGLENVGVLMDTYHAWWDPELVPQLRRAGDRILAVQVNDWAPEVVHAAGPNKRAVMGDGCIDFAPFVEGLEGFDGWFDAEVIGNDELAALPLPAVFERIGSSFEATIGRLLR